MLFLRERPRPSFARASFASVARLSLFAFLFMGMTAFLDATPAYADFKICNTTGSRVGAAIGYKTVKGSWVSEGWWNLASNSCETLLKGKLINRYYYVYVIDYDRGGEWGGKLHMCTDDKVFTVEGVDQCAQRGYKRTGFFEVDTNEEPTWTVRLTDNKDAEAKAR